MQLRHGAWTSLLKSLDIVKRWEPQFCQFSMMWTHLMYRDRGTFAVAFAEHEVRFRENMEKIEMWRAALTEAANLSGWLVQDG